MSENLDGIDVFVAVVAAGSFSGAAQRLHLTRSAVAKIIGRLEARLDARLLHRTTRTLSLTEAGQAWHEHCVRALAELQAGQAALNSSRRDPAGLLRISVPVLFGRQCIAPALVALSTRYPRLNLQIDFSDRVCDVIGEGFDLAVRVARLPDSGALASRRLGAQRMVIVAAPRYLQARGRPIVPADIAAHDGVQYGRDGARRGWAVLLADGTVAYAEPRCRILLDDLQAIADAAVLGAGLAWLPCWLVAPCIAAGRLELVIDCGSVAATDIHLVWPHSRHMPAKTRAAIDVLAEEVPRHLTEMNGGGR
jgi:DNA-binding transcriptional LysR family regulator